MPHLTIGLDSVSGPMIALLIGPSEPRMDALRAAGLSVPAPTVARLLIDTGASCTVLNQSIVDGLGLTPSGQTDVCTPSTGQGQVQLFQYDVGLMLHHSVNVRFFSSLPVIAADLSKQGIQGLLGRDVLNNCLLVYDGAGSTFSLAF